MQNLADLRDKVNIVAALLRFLASTEDRPDLRRALVEVNADDLAKRLKARAALELDDDGRQVLAILGIRPPTPSRVAP